VVRRRARSAALDQAWDTVLRDFPVELHPLIRAYWENLQQGQRIRSDLSSAMTRAGGVRWWQIDGVVSRLAA
jgi:hypothetical protein